MKTIKQYNIRKDIITPQTCYITKNAEVVNLISLDDSLELIVICDKAEALTELRTFKVCSTYETIYENNIKYVGNFGEQHLVEIIK